jgi:hypothetical protein
MSEKDIAALVEAKSHDTATCLWCGNSQDNNVQSHWGYVSKSARVRIYRDDAPRVKKRGGRLTDEEASRPLSIARSGALRFGRGAMRRIPSVFASLAWRSPTVLVVVAAMLP